MHLDVCLIIVNCVLVGLDWFFTHDALKYLTSHVHEYFMHTYLFFSFLFFVLVVMCSLSLSLSLSLSWIDYVMVPKARKSTLGRNPLQGSGSSSSDLIPPLHIRFCDEKS